VKLTVSSDILYAFLYQPTVKTVGLNIDHDLLDIDFVNYKDKNYSSIGFKPCGDIVFTILTLWHGKI
jgi:hypothetical protein